MGYSKDIERYSEDKITSLYPCLINHGQNSSSSSICASELSSSHFLTDALFLHCSSLSSSSYLFSIFLFILRILIFGYSFIFRILILLFFFNFYYFYAFLILGLVGFKIICMGLVGFIFLADLWKRKKK